MTRTEILYCFVFLNLLKQTKVLLNKQKFWADTDIREKVGIVVISPLQAEQKDKQKEENKGQKREKVMKE